MALSNIKNSERVITAPPKRKISPNPVVPKKKPLPKEWDVKKPKVSPTPKGIFKFFVFNFL